MSDPDDTNQRPERELEEALGASPKVPGEACADVAALRRVVRGTMPPGEAARIMEHVALCGACRRAYADLERAWATARAAAAETADSPAPPARVRLRPGWVLATAAVCCLALVITVRSLRPRAGAEQPFAVIESEWVAKGRQRPVSREVPLEVQGPWGRVRLDRPLTYRLKVPAGVVPGRLTVRLTDLKTGRVLPFALPPAQRLWTVPPGVLRHGATYVLSAVATRASRDRLSTPPRSGQAPGRSAR